MAEHIQLITKVNSPFFCEALMLSRSANVKLTGLTMILVKFSLESIRYLGLSANDLRSCKL